MGKVAKMVSGFLTSGGAAAVMTGAGLPLEVVTPVVAALTALFVWLVPNAKAERNPNA